jgi:hypothetical protein
LHEYRSERLAGVAIAVGEGSETLHGERINPQIGFFGVNMVL